MSGMDGSVLVRIVGSRPVDGHLFLYLIRSRSRETDDISSDLAVPRILVMVRISCPFGDGQTRDGRHGVRPSCTA